MKVNYIQSQFEIVRNMNRCVLCHLCEKECSYGVHHFDKERNIIIADEEKCVDCQRCVAICPTRALKIVKSENTFKDNDNWKQDTIENIFRQAATGGILLSSMGNPHPQVNYFDKLLINASQVTNPSIDPLREPMETKVFLGRKSEKVERDKNGKIIAEKIPELELSLPVMFSAMSFGSISYNAHQALAQAAETLHTYYNTGEGGLHENLYRYQNNTIVQIASGRFGVHPDYLKAGAAIEIKMGQGAKPGIGGHLLGAKVGAEVARTRMIGEHTDAISPAPHHDIYSIEDLRQLIYAIKEATNYEKPVIVKIAAVHNIGAIASGIARSGADAISIDGYTGGTGASPLVIRNNVGIPIELALAAVDKRLRDEGVRNSISLIVSGSIRNSADVIKAIALGADAVSIGTAALMAMGCHNCRACTGGKCNWGIATQDPELVKRLDPEEAATRLVNLVHAWKQEIREMMGGMGINSIEALKGNRAMLRGIDLNAKELEILGVKHAGE
jgi:Glutamate synthase domain 2